jgi:hypothetical protein
VSEAWGEENERGEKRKKKRRENPAQTFTSVNSENA